MIADNITLNYVGGVDGAQTIINVYEIAAPRDTAQSASVPGTPVTGSGPFTPILGWDNASASDAADAYPPARDWMIINNIIARRLPSVANYSEWGFGALGSSNFGYDPAITDDDSVPWGRGDYASPLYHQRQSHLAHDNGDFV